VRSTEGRGGGGGRRGGGGEVKVGWKELLMWNGKSLWKRGRLKREWGVADHQDSGKETHKMQMQNHYLHICARVGRRIGHAWCAVELAPNRPENTHAETRVIQRQTDRQTHRLTGRQKGRQASKQTDRQTLRLTGRQTGRQASKQTDRRTGTVAYSMTHIHIKLNKDTFTCKWVAKRPR
jgi:hypothetical protein